MLKFILPPIGVLIFTLVLWLVYSADRRDSEKWRDYAITHHCEAKGTKAGKWVQVLGSKDGGIAYTGDQAVYVCDGGEIVIR